MIELTDEQDEDAPDGQQPSARRAAKPDRATAHTEQMTLDEAGQTMLKAAAMRMPFGRYQGTRLIDLPEPYVVWFRREGFPDGTLGTYLALIYEIKANGLEKLVRPLLPPESEGQSTMSVARRDNNT